MEDIASQGNKRREQDRAVLKFLEQSRRRLVELGTRNRLIHVNRANVRANALNIVNERSDDIFTILYRKHRKNRKHRKMRFHALRSEVETDKENTSDTPKLGAWSGAGDFDESRYTDNKLETYLTPDALQKRLLRLAKDAHTAEQEQGINILFLALGFLTWYEDKNSGVKREAPLILLPVQLTRNARTATYEISIRDDDIEANLPLQERLKNDFGIKIPEIDIDDEWCPSSYFDQIDKRIAQKANWSIDRDGMQLGFFSFAKLLMYRDLDPNNWPSGALLGHPFTRGLLAGGITSEPPLFDKDTKLDQVLAPADIIQVVDADSSQTKVIEEVRDHRSLVVQGPPGTGKSQTITNIIASAVYDGKRVLFMAEKMAALEVVHKKLVDAGLRDICLELHSRSANKKAILTELARTLRSGAAVPSMPSPPDELQKVRDNLNQASDILHQPILKSGETPHTVIGI